MQILKSELTAALETIKPAISKNELVEAMTHVWLDGETISAYSDTSLGIQLPLATTLAGGLNGKLLLDLLAKTTAAQVVLESPEAGEYLVKAGRGKLRGPLLPPERRIGHPPALPGAKPFCPPQAFLDALVKTELSLGTKSSVPDQLGVNLVLQRGVLQAYATDAATLAWATIKECSYWPFAEDVSVTLPTCFVEAFNKLAKAAKQSVMLTITADDVLAETKDGVKIFAKNIDVAHLSDFQKVIQRELKNVQLFPIPKRLAEVLQRTTVFKEQYIYADIESDELQLQVDSTIAEFRERIPLEMYPNEISCRIDPKLIKKALAYSDSMGISSSATVMKGDNFLYMTGNLSAPSKQDYGDEIPF